MNIRMLEMFVEVVRQGSFSGAARKLHASQPAVSKAIQALEEDCGIRLLDRQYQGVHLTEQGSFVYARVLRIMAEVEALEAEIAAVHGLEKGILRLGIPPVGSLTFFAAQLATFRDRYPGLHVDLHEDGCTALEAKVLSGELEIGFTLLPTSPQFDQIQLFDEPLLALMPQRFPLNGRTHVKLDDLISEPLILFEQGFVLNERIERLAHQRHLEYREGVRSGQLGFIIMLVAAGLGVGMLPKLDLNERLLSSVQVALLDEEDLRWRGAFIWRKGNALSPAARAWLALLPATARHLAKSED